MLYSKQKKAHLVLADGRIFSGRSFGYHQGSVGEVVFNTSMAGYQEILTDPSYQGQIVVMTYPEIGNYGINQVDTESKKICLSGLIVKNASPIASNYRSQDTLLTYLKQNRIPAIEGIDTRALVRHIREEGAMQALLIVGDLKNKKAIEKKARELPTMEGMDLVRLVSCQKPYRWVKVSPVIIKEKNRLKKSPSLLNSKKSYQVIAYDYGIKHNILRMLVDHGCDVKVVPAQYPAESVLKEKPDGVFLSNGPGDPSVCTYAIENVEKLLGKIPMFGICLGHQILALALGARTFKLKFGHHGGNHPVMDLETKKVEITSQNHGFAVDKKTFPRDVSVTHLNLNDQTVEGLSHAKMQAFSVQYHPEAAPGPHDSHYLFERFIQMMKN